MSFIRKYLLLLVYCISNFYTSSLPLSNSSDTNSDKKQYIKIGYGKVISPEILDFDKGRKYNMDLLKPMPNKIIFFEYK